MPKETRSKKEIHEIRERILNQAIKLMADIGFNNFSMRKLATRLKMSAANIYNYYKNKDELYLDIQIMGFQQLYNIFLAIDKREPDPYEKLRKFAKSYISFSMKNSETYDIMFSRNTPKYADYISTELEPIATKEKKTAMQIIILTAKVVKQLNDKNSKNNSNSPEETLVQTAQMWISLHGASSLYNSRVLQEVLPETDKMIEKIIDIQLKQFFGGTE